jgi:hypothetical protein
VGWGATATSGNVAPFSFTPVPNVVIGGVEFGTTQLGYAFRQAGTIRHVIFGGRPVTTAQLPTGWQMRGVWASGTGYQAYLFDGKGAFSIWALDATGAFVSSQRQAVTQINLLETQVGFDLNQDGTRTTFTKANVVIGGVEFGSTQQGYAFAHNGHLRQVIFGGKPVTAAQLPTGWQMRGVWISGSGYQAYLFDGKGAFSIWMLDATGAFVSSQRQTAAQIAQIESTIKYDLDQNGKIGP